MNFSVLLSVYKEEKPFHLVASLNSLLEQTLLPTEIILVEDGPLSDELYEILKRYEKRCPILKRYPLEHNCGLGKALNYGLSKTTCETVARMDTDDICMPERFQKQIFFLEKATDVDLVGCWTIEFMQDEGKEMQILSTKRFPRTVWENFRSCTSRNPVEHSAVIFRKKAVLDVGGYQHCLFFEDYYLWARMFVNGAKFYNIPEPLMYFRMTNESYARRGGWRYVMNEYSALKKFHEIGFLSKVQFTKNILIRLPIRLLPNKLRKIFYKKLLRKK